MRLRGGKGRASLNAKKAVRKEARLDMESAKVSKPKKAKKTVNDESNVIKVPYLATAAGSEEKQAAKRVARAANADSIIRNIPKVERQLAELRYADDNDPSTRDRRSKLERKLAKQRKNLRQLEKLGALDAKEQFGAQVEPLDEDELNQEEEVSGGDQIPRSKKRKISGSGLGDEDFEGIGEDVAAPEVIVIDETPKKIKKEKKDKKHKKRKISNSSQGSSQLLDSIPAFREHESEKPAIIEEANMNKSAVFNRKTGQNATQDIPVPPTSEQAKQSALLDTIARSRSRSESIGGDRIYQALLASMLEPPSPPSPMSSIGDNHRSLIEVGQSAIAAPTVPNNQNPVRDRAFIAHAPAAKKDLTIVPRESPILPPKRTFSSTRIIPAAKEDLVEKTKSQKKDGERSKKSRKSSSSKPDDDSQESTTLSQTVTALKETASATVIEGIFSQADPINTNKRILPPAKPSVSKPLTCSSNIDSSSPAAPPTPQSRPSKRMEGEAEDWELSSGRLRARVEKQGTNDDGEVEESKPPLSFPTPP